MKKIEKMALKLVKKGFTVSDWKDFSDELKANELILSELAKKLETYDIESIREITDVYPFVICRLSSKIQMQLVNNSNFHLLSEDLQLQIVEKNNNKVKYASEEVQKKFATNNPLKLSFLSPGIQKLMVDSNIFYLEFASQDIQVEYAKKDVNVLCRCSNLVQCGFIKSDPNYYVKCSMEVKRDIISLNNLSPDKISIETLEMYLSSHYDNLSLEELDNYRKLIESSNREDKEQVLNYVQYLQVNLNKKKL